MTWFDRIEVAKRRRRWLVGPLKRWAFTNEEKALAEDWGTCGVGETLHLDGFRVPLVPLRTIHMHVGGFAPQDEVLKELGSTFFRAILRGQPYNAEVTLRTIKLRARFLCGIESVETTLKNLEQATHADLDRH